MSKLTPTVLLLSMTLILWSVSASLSQYLSQDFARTHHAQPSAGATSAELDELRHAAQDKPQDAQAHLNLAFGILKHAYANGDGGMLMDAVKSFHRVLELSPEHPDALLGLATLCLEAGIIDKALEYYPRYLAVRPDDMRAKSDYALALVRGGESGKAESLLQEVLAENETFFPALISMAMVMRVDGKVDKAEEFALKAQKQAPDEETAGRVQSFIDGLRQSEPSESGAQQGGHAHSHPREGEVVSPARAVSDYFREHPIVGPKVKKISWPNPSLARIELENFPVDQMPPFAKEKFLNGIRERFSFLSETMTIELTAYPEGTELLSIRVGGVDNRSADAGASIGAPPKSTKEAER